MNNSFPQRDVSHLIILSKHLFCPTLFYILLSNLVLDRQKMWVICWANHSLKKCVPIQYKSLNHIQ